MIDIVRYQQNAILESLVLKYVLVLSKELGNEPFVSQRFMELPIIGKSLQKTCKIWDPLGI